MNMRYKISVVIPTYNCHMFIVEAIESVLMQTYNNFEILVVDDGSTDNTKMLLTNYIQNKLIKYIYQDNQGVSVARNTGITNSIGELIAFLDADDALLPHSLEKRVRAFELFPEAEIVFTDYFEEKFNDDSVAFISHGDFEEELLSYGCQTINEYTLFDSKLYKYFSEKQPNLLWTGAITINRNVLKSVGYFNSSLKVSEDTDMWRRILKCHQAAFVREPLTRYISYRGSYDKYEAHYLNLIEELKNIIIKKSISIEQAQKHRRTISDSYLAIAYKKYIPMLDFRMARCCLLKSIWFYFFNYFAWKQLLLCCLPVTLYLSIRKVRIALTKMIANAAVS